MTSPDWLPLTDLTDIPHPRKVNAILTEALDETATQTRRVKSP
jgi:hypothetical protein